MEDIQAAQINNSDEPLIKKENIILLFCSVGLGILFEILFYKKPLGLSYPLFAIAFYATLFWNLRGSLDLKLDFKWLLSIPILALSFAYLFFANELFMALNFLAIPVLIVAHTLLLASNHRYSWFEPGFLTDLIYGMIARPLLNIIKPFSIVSRIARRKAEPGRFAAVGKVFIGLLVSIPLIMVIVSLLASADEVFNHFVGQIPNIFENLSLDDFVAKVCIVTIISCLVFSYLWSLLHQRMLVTDGVVRNQTALSYRFLDPVTVITILTLVDSIYILFTIIQFSYLFGSLSMGLPDNFTYAQYARRGFFELVAVTLINLVILLGNINFIKAVGARVDKAAKVLNSVLVACTLIMLFSAHFRMSLYEEAYGYTYLRVLTHAFMLFLFALLAASLYKVWKEKMSLLKAYIVISIIAYTGINYTNIDVVIAKKNIERYAVEKSIDISYLTSLSDDAVPYLVEFMESSLDKESAKQLENTLYERKERLERKSSTWQSFNVAQYRARKELGKVELTYDPAAAEQMRMHY